MQDVFALESTAPIDPNDTYVQSYPHLLSFFRSKPLITPEDFVIGAHMVYGWMPTALELHQDPGTIDLATGADLLTRVKSHKPLTNAEIESVAALVNHSVVGASKLLHFVDPETYAIWDSKVYAFVREQTPHHYRVNNINEYRNFLDLLATLRGDPRFGAFKTSVDARLGYPVSDFRALETVMFLCSP